MMDNVAAIILAAGKASRFRAADPHAKTKVVALYEGEPMVRRAAIAALGAGASPVVIVTGCERDAVHEALAGLDVTFAHNGAYETGIASSLQAGVQALPDTCAATFIMLGDMPLVDAALLQSLAEARRDNPSAVAFVPVYQGQRGNPVLLSRALFDSSRNLKGDEGARRMLRDPALLVVEVQANAAAAMDVDTPEGLR